MMEQRVGALGPALPADQQGPLTPEDIKRLRSTTALDLAGAFTPCMVLMLFLSSDDDAIARWLATQPGPLGVVLPIAFYGLSFLGITALLVYMIALVRDQWRVSREVQQGVVTQADGVLAWQ